MSESVKEDFEYELKKLAEPTPLFLRVCARIIAGYIIILFCIIALSLFLQFLSYIEYKDISLANLTISFLFLTGMILLFSGIAFILGTFFSFILKRLTNTD